MRLGLAGYWSLYTRSNARFLDASAYERRDVLDMRYYGTQGQFDLDAEAMLQTGSVGEGTIFEWVFGSIAGYKLIVKLWPHIAVQIDGASGDRHPHDGRIETFNSLFPNGY